MHDFRSYIFAARIASDSGPTCLLTEVTELDPGGFDFTDRSLGSSSHSVTRVVSVLPKLPALDSFPERRGAIMWRKYFSLRLLTLASGSVFWSIIGVTRRCNYTPTMTRTFVSLAWSIPAPIPPCFLRVLYKIYMLLCSVCSTPHFKFLESLSVERKLFFELDVTKIIHTVC